MAIEIEHKFRLSGEGWRKQIRSSTLLRQGYLANTTRASVRVRLAAEDEAWLSVKAMTPGRSRAEYEVSVPVDDASAMLDTLCEGALIEKWRHIVRHEGHTWEIDEFLGDNAGLIVAELEVDSVDEKFAKPSWLGEEVTHDERYYNFRLSQQPWCRWPENLKALK